MLLRTGEADCSVQLLVSAEPIRQRCAGDVKTIDRFSVWRNGAYAAWLDPAGVRVLSDRQDRGDRPWVPPEPTRARTAKGLTPAATETLPAE